jgi:hypothetical protein
MCTFDLDFFDGLNFYINAEQPVGFRTRTYSGPAAWRPSRQAADGPSGLHDSGPAHGVSAEARRGRLENTVDQSGEASVRSLSESSK